MESNQSPNPDEEFETTLMEVERSLLKLKERHKQVQQSQKQKLDLEERLNTVSPENTAEVQKIKEELQELTVGLETELLKDPGKLAYIYQETIKSSYNRKAGSRRTHSENWLQRKSLLQHK